jgi:protocatechuate 3,4-dioxygenase beta subunit
MIPIPPLAFAVALAIFGLTLLAPRNAAAQASAGITGTVSDTSGAVVAGAHVNITNEGTSSSDRTVTSSAGTYSFKGVLPGKYTIAVDAPGFKKELQKGVNVEVSTTSTIDFTLERRRCELKLSR